MANKDHAQGYDDALTDGTDRSGDVDDVEAYRAGRKAAEQDTGK